MASYICNLIHFVWSTSERRRWIDDAWRDDLFGDFGGILRNKHGRLIAAGGMPDHVHLLVSLPATLSLAEVANALKANSSRWIHQQIPGLDRFRWQDGYGAFSISRSAQDQVVEYIRNQAEHHRTRTFEEEFELMLKRHGVEFDPQRIWS